ncbi:hypothetical protein TOT_010000647 [Theileria orientalis strain Shintoku]|uniref:Uncharacterized protein n=1 Tax=Theileria orientalis strain Shintoku TaxID=869250 RepID=J4CCD2_THEOR|nr:hypothetical protein TOT_010000647 [Theileria orientalis strain Shintoku]BAM39187.1 hypothetical protein TOT_010000647 [Theileria orientalis strain Shintoku]|eukprot:XP_009689488.1 hypothetical protein TOT_010000647 [Theileria orientalis strain Shintoku]
MSGTANPTNHSAGSTVNDEYTRQLPLISMVYLMFTQHTSTDKYGYIYVIIRYYSYFVIKYSQVQQSTDLKSMEQHLKVNES